MANFKITLTLYEDMIHVQSYNLTENDEAFSGDYYLENSVKQNTTDKTRLVKAGFCHNIKFLIKFKENCISFFQRIFQTASLKANDPRLLLVLVYLTELILAYTAKGT